VPEVVVIQVSPEHIGIPSRRPRKYTIACNKNMFTSIFLGDSFFGNDVLRRVETDGSIFLVAPPDELARYKAYLLNLRHVPVEGLEGLDVGDVPWESCLTVSTRSRLNEYQGAYNGGQQAGDVGFCNIAVNFGFSRLRVFPRCMITLLRGSMVWDLRRRRLLVPLEHLAVNGVPLYVDLEHESLMALPLEYLTQMTMGSVKSMAGNMMSIPTIGSIILSILFKFSRV
jgi:hypothetical protein